MRFKRRYFCVEIVFQNDPTPLNKIQINKLKHTNLSETIHKSIEQFYGDYGMAVMMPSFSVIYFNSVTNLAILRTARDLKKPFHTLLTFIQKLDEFDVSLQVVHVSGSIRKCKQFLGTHCQKSLRKLCESEEQNANCNQNNDPKTVIDVLEKIIDICEANDNQFNLK